MLAWWSLLELLCWYHIIKVKSLQRLWRSGAWRWNLGTSSLTHYGLVMWYGIIDLFNIGSGNGLLPEDTKPLPEPMLTDHQWAPVTFVWGQLSKRYLSCQSLKLAWKSFIWSFIEISQGPISYLIVAWWHHMATEIWVNIGSGNDLLPDGTKPLP